MLWDLNFISLWNLKEILSAFLPIQIALIHALASIFLFGLMVHFFCNVYFRISQSDKIWNNLNLYDLNNKSAQVEELWHRKNVWFFFFGLNALYY